MILTRACYLLRPLLLIMPQWSSPWPCQASVFLYISPSDSLPALINYSKSNLGYPWFHSTQTFSKNLSCSKIKSTFVMTPHGFKALILQKGGFKFWGNIHCILPTHVNIRKRWQVWDEVPALRLSWSLKLKLQSRQHRKMVRVNIKTAINSALLEPFYRNTKVCDAYASRGENPKSHGSQTTPSCKSCLQTDVGQTIRVFALTNIQSRQVKITLQCIAYFLSSSSNKLKRCYFVAC